MHSDTILTTPIDKIICKYSGISDFLETFQIPVTNNSKTLIETLNEYNDLFWEDNNTTPEELIQNFLNFFNSLVTVTQSLKIENIEILPGFDKSGNPEKCSLFLKPGELTCIVGPTGSGKSRLLADIEWMADGDTPTGRIIRINGEIPDDEYKRSMGGRLIAQITQNMNFVLDMDVENFLFLHAQSRFIEKPDEKISEVIEMANHLSGERFDPCTPVTFLSGGQSRALMIADVACIGRAPIVIIDELENAGIDRKKALELLISKEKIVIMATHDPLLILQADKRVVIKNGGIDKILATNDSEKKLCSELEKVDTVIQNLRNHFRKGNTIESDKLADELKNLTSFFI